MRKHVTPTHPRATIHDPERGRPLPPEGVPVTWSAYWIRLEGRGDVQASDLAEAAGPDGPAEPPAAED